MTSVTENCLPDPVRTASEDNILFVPEDHFS